MAVSPVLLVVLGGSLVAGAAAAAIGRQGDLGRLGRRPPPPAVVTDVALAVDLVAAALRSGLALGPSLRAVAAACDTGGVIGPGLTRLATLVESGRAPEHGPGDDGDALGALHEAVAFALRSGAPVAPLLAEAARTMRLRRRDVAVGAAGRLSAALVLPLGLAALPGFLLLGIAPVVVRLVTSLG